jgi:hypothetical protein
MDTARPSTTVVHPAKTRTAHAHPNAAARAVIDLEELPGDRRRLSPRCIRQPHLERRDDANNGPSPKYQQTQWAALFPATPRRERSCCRD